MYGYADIKKLYERTSERALLQFDFKKILDLATFLFFSVLVLKQQVVVACSRELLAADEVNFIFVFCLFFFGFENKKMLPVFKKRITKQKNRQI